MVFHTQPVVPLGSLHTGEKFDNQLTYVYIEYDLPIKTNKTLLSILKTMRHGSFVLVHSVVNKVPEHKLEHVKY